MCGLCNALSFLGSREFLKISINIWFQIYEVVIFSTYKTYLTFAIGCMDLISSKFVKSCEHGNNGQNIFNIFSFILSIFHIVKAYKARDITWGQRGWSEILLIGNRQTQQIYKVTDYRVSSMKFNFIKDTNRQTQQIYKVTDYRCPLWNSIL